MIFRICFLASLMVWNSLAFAQEDYESIAQEAKQRAPLQTAKYREEAMQADLKARQLIKLNQDGQHEEINKLFAAGDKSTTKASLRTDEKKPLNNVMVFISFSMPRASIIAYLREARVANASIVIRGLINNSFKETFKTVSELVKESNGGGIELNPIAFVKFHIKQVPTVVVTNGNDCMRKENCHIDHDYDLLAGNIGLQAALKEIRDHGKVSTHQAEQAFNRLNGGANV